MAPTDRANEPGPQRAVVSAPGKWGALRLTTTGRRSGEPRSVIIGYYEDGPNLVSMAMNGWGAAEPAWWLNLQADPQAIVELAGGSAARCSAGPQSARSVNGCGSAGASSTKNLDSYAARRPQETASSSSSHARRPNEPAWASVLSPERC